MNVVVIGGGPAGMLAAIKSKDEGNIVTLIEKNNILGKKMLITGKGRCNITSSLDISEFINKIPTNGKFLYSAFKNFDNNDILNLIGIKTKNERGNRVFPESDKSQDVVDSIKKKLNGIEILYNTEANEILITTDNNGIKKVTGVRTYNCDIKADKVIIATGGKSYPKTGSTGDGYLLAKKIGHNIIEPKSALIPLTTSGESLEICRNLMGLSLKNVHINVFNDNKKIYEDFGEMLFTHFGLSGPIILSSSVYLAKQKFVNAKIEIDLKPALSDEKLDERILRDFSNEKNKNFKNSLDKLLPQKMIPIIVGKMNINKMVNEVTKGERKKLVNLLKHFIIEISGFRPIEEAIITQGGIDTKEINSKTMESKLVSGLFFAGEVIDVNGITGGFNLQIAYSTGYTAGKDIQ